MTAKVFDIETLLITEVFLHRVIKVNNTFFGIIEYEGIYDAIYLKSGVLIDNTTALTPNSCVVNLYRALAGINWLTHILNEMKIADYVREHQIVYPVNDFDPFTAGVELEVQRT